MVVLTVEPGAVLEICGLTLPVRALGVQLAARPDLGRVEVGATVADHHATMEVRPLAPTLAQAWPAFTRDLAVLECRGLRWDVSAALAQVALQNLACGVRLSVWEPGAGAAAPPAAVATLLLDRALAFERGALREGCPVPPAAPAAGGAPLATLPAVALYAYGDPRAPWGAPAALAPWREGLHWIWASDPRLYDAATRRVRGAPVLQRAFDSPVATTATLYSTADDEHEVWLNGRPVARGARRAPDVQVTPGLAIRAGRNDLWVRVRNFEEWGHGGLCAVLAPDAPAVPPVRTDDTWRSW